MKDAPASSMGLDTELTETQAAVAGTLRAFAQNVMRPAGIVLDRLTPEEVIGSNSPFWDVRRRFLDLGIGPSLMEGLPPDEIAGLQSIIWESLGYGDAGLAVAMGAALMPASLARLFGKPFLVDRFSEKSLGCWAITEPDRGSDMLDADGDAFAAYGTRSRPNCIARVSDGGLIIDGQKSAWVSNGTIADVCVLFSAVESDAGAGGAVVYVPLDAPGVSRGKALDKMGQRSLNQGQIFFDDVRLPLDYLAVEPQGYAAAARMTLAHANAGMSAIFTGVAQAAYEHAHAYAHERRQGGVPLVRHQQVRYRLFHMFRRLEAARALSRRVMRFNVLSGTPALHGCIAAKITATQAAFEVANDALQMFGGYGLTREYPVEKLLRDARAGLIEDGCNEFLAIKGGSLLVEPPR
jgi:acyl-CoA dehydrogenase